MHWTVYMMLKYLKHGERYGHTFVYASHTLWWTDCRSRGIRQLLVSGILNFWREMHNSVAGYLRDDRTASG